MEIGLAVGGAFLSSALNVLFDRLAPNGDLLNMFRQHTDDVELFEKLGDILLGLQIVLSDAENKKASNQFVSQWLHKLQTAVDAAENLIEQVHYEALRLKVETSNQQVSDLNLCLSDDFFINIKKKLEDTIKKLEVLEKQIGRLGLKEHFISTKQETRTPSTSLVDDSGIFGRKNEIENLIGRLLSMDTKGKNLAVVPIVGMGGLGKTTLAKAVYNDKRVQKHFGLTAWFCVSEAYDAFRITKGLLQEIDSTDLKADDNLNQLQVKLKEKLNGKRFLVVLDDVWNDNYPEWDDLRNLFLQGDIGSKIIITTRKESVALMMGSGAIYMGILSSEDSWALFKRHSLEHKDPKEHPEFEEVGKQIADKCKGLPLALKALAGILRSKSEVDEWRYILRSEIWELPSCSNGILPALMLSYNDLPAHLKQCFAYCAIYPKDYQFCKDQVIHLWIANGLVHQFHSGNQYFIELRSRSLFEMASKPSERDVEGFLMHDLVNDLAQIASSNLCIRLEENKGSHMLEQCRHMSYSIGRDGEFEKLKSLFKSEHLRTLLPIDIQFHYSILSKRVQHNILPTLRSLRALSLSGYANKELPNDLFIKLKLLRFLDLSCTWITKLPDSIFVLYNLETLLLSSCADLEELPLQMEKLINLRHLDISNTRRLKMPLHLSRLKSLQVLVGAKFLVGVWRMEYLGEAQNLYGSLSVEKLENVVDRREAVKAKMREKNHVEQLSLEWSGSSIADNSQTERDILDELRPHKNIKEVEISGYRGTNFPNWVADPLFLKLVKLSLRNCKDCYSLPALGQLPFLKFLSVIGMYGIIEVTEEFYGSLSSKKPFNSLVELRFEDMTEWKQWHALGIGEFPTLEHLLIENCPELSLETPIQLEAMKQIEALCISGCNSVTSLPFSILPTTLKTIEISRCPKLKLEAPFCEMFVEELRMNHCGCVDDISAEFLPTARELSIENCHNVTRFLIPTATEILRIWNCENVEKLSMACGGAAQMTSLSINGCKKLKCLPERMQELLPSLKELRLSDCPEIEGELPFNLQKLFIRNCKKLVNGRKEWHLQRLTELVMYHDGSDEDIEHWELPCSIQRLTIKNLITLSSQHLKSLTSLQYLDIQSQGQLSSFSHLTSLQTLQICNLQSLSESALPSSLSHLDISNCPNLQSLSESALPSSLSHLDISNCPNLQSLSESALPSSLSHLDISNCPNLQSLSESALPSSLSHLDISNCPNLQSLSESALPSSLSHLDISNCPNLQSLSESALPSSLSHLDISNCPNLQSLSESALPSSLSHLDISNCPNLQSLSESALPSSLSHLDISNCPNLQSLPLNGIPSSLSKLSISECLLLEPLLEFEKGEYWPQIAHIPTIDIDWECM
ncbi:putative disease resistance RPP13-like protein 1 isoform X2 [Solanum pennellii]|uniref:Disease resistance RPP13-like protein 1 isoform X2 n=1 Tax=Solanum pennellii TaxID=28526 RepID=A0ABM1UZ39_SOLPN|nr:putative disease resistance RPP13-like protein 1 isoform X2 [Solanum pennellii]